eukprot:TRINITY_DN1589_c0_g3_i1.p1 TRINITY_DN1589_c0_g3~~TRINITY_DN1589_c0_g3_i1.p1  ORF type:complete len:345 (-),score=10.72 TRINITY_DN1589_c0_g3_i1:2239-3273(-)
MVSPSTDIESVIKKLKGQVKTLLHSPAEGYTATHVFMLGWRNDKEEFCENDIKLVNQMCEKRGYYPHKLYIEDYVKNESALSHQIHAACNEKTLAIVYFTSHGKIQKGHLAFVNLTDTFYFSILLSTLQNLFEVLSSDTEANVLFILDSCYSGAGIKNTNHNIQVLAACCPNECTSFEFKGTSAFTNRLCKILMEDTAMVEAATLQEKILHSKPDLQSMPCFRRISGANLIYLTSRTSPMPSLEPPDLAAMIVIKVPRTALTGGELSTQLVNMKNELLAGSQGVIDIIGSHEKKSHAYYFLRASGIFLIALKHLINFDIEGFEIKPIQLVNLSIFYFGYNTFAL